MFAEAGIEFRGGVEVGKAKSLESLSGTYDAVLLGTGAELPARLDIPGEERTVEALAFLARPESFNLGKKVIVVGGGNVAMDACRTAVRLGVETWVYYRKTFENMPANPLEVEDARQEGVQFCMFQAPVEVREGGVVFRDCINIIDDETGQLRTRILDGTDHFVPCDTLITAVSERPDYAVLSGTAALGANGKPAIGETQQVEGLPNVWVAGDFLLGPRTVVEAVASAKKAVNSITELLVPPDASLRDPVRANASGGGQQPGKH